MSIDESTDSQPDSGVTVQVTIADAIAQAFAHAMRANPDVFCAGQDIGVAGGVFGTFAGLHGEFGERRVVDTPISEQAMVGLGVGAAASGLRPVIDLMFMDFVLSAMDQIVNQAAKLSYMSGGHAALPLTITTAAGAGQSAGAQHSQSLEALLCHVPGLKVVMPSNPSDAKGLLLASINDDNPVVYIKHKRLLDHTGPCAADAFEVPLGRAAVARGGADCTLVSYGSMVPAALEAAEMLAAENLDLEVIDLRTLQPLDIDTVVSSVEHTNRCVVAHEAVGFGGLGAEIAAQVQQHAFDHLDAPVARVAAPFSPVPFSPALEPHVVPDAARIVEAVRATCGDGSAALN